jgi:hypothetical protein
MARSLFLCSVLALVLLASGCGGVQTAEVHGTVTYDGKPLPKGTIAFVTEGKAPEVLDISNGAFSGPITVGKKKIVINAYKQGPPVPEDTPGAGEVQLENYIPAAYNANSKITKEVTAAGPNDFKFEIPKE